MATLLFTDPRFGDHDTRDGHPERPARLDAVQRGLASCPAAEDLVTVAPRPATVDELALVHDAAHLGALQDFCANGGGRIDADTIASAASWEVARLAAGAGLDAVARLRAGEADGAFLAVRPPGHHATPSTAMGFCLLNNVAVTAAALAAAGERVVIVDIDAHHGNGTEAAFWDDDRVTYVSIHEFPAYPGTGRARDIGGPAAVGSTVNLPMPSGAAGDVYRAAIDEVIVPVIERERPDWLLLSTGFDAHRADPLTDLGLSAGDYHDLTARLLATVPAGRRIVFLEGGYDLDAVAACASATVTALAGEHHHPEPSTGDGPGAEVIEAVRRLHHLDE